MGKTKPANNNISQHATPISTDPSTASGKARVAAQLELLQARKQAIPDITLTTSLLKKVKKVPMKKGVKAKKEKIYQRALINSEKAEERVTKAQRKAEKKKMLKNAWD
ncbi:hypothetical protein BC938DRAFT_482712 [Jimgerdemannia flammicorona]|uniref:Uncharacterized protein n=1 Tax=Jimgerdemannia flammicorona TaxID=994334 RepID=A0A433QW54_9FUNG|nr:hypothetical protein BC938DRAFT_482712 [Jimgerdemannia flammicorona]